MAKTTTQPEQPQGNAYSGTSSTAPPRFHEFAGIRAYSYAAQALLKLAEGAPDNLQAAIFIGFAALVDTTRYAGMPRRKAGERSES